MDKGFFKRCCNFRIAIRTIKCNTMHRFLKMKTSVCLLKHEFYKVIANNCINRVRNMSV